MQRGFTLIEFMLVMVITVLASSVVLFSISDNSGRDTGRSMQQQLNYLQQLALGEQQVLALQLSERTGRYLRYQGKQWQLLEDELLQVVQLDSDQQWQLSVQGEPQVLSETLDDFAPQLIFMADASFNRFSLKISGESWQVSGQGLRIGFNE